MSKQQVALLENLPSAIEIFANGAADDFITKIKAEVDSFQKDISTEEGRKAIRSFCRKIGSAKLRVDELGQQLTEEEKKKIEVVNTERRRVKAIFEQMQAEFIKELEEFEEKQSARIATMESAVALIEGMKDIPDDYTAEQIKQRLDSLSTDDKIDWQEFTERARIAKLKSTDVLQKAYEIKVKQEKEQAELAEFRRQQAEREQKERDERIAAEAAEKARKDAEEAARIEAERIAKEEQEKQEKIERAKKEAEEKQRQEEERRLKAEQDAKEAQERAEQAERDRIAAEEKAEKDRKEAEERRQREAKEAEDRRQRELKEAQEKAERDAKEAADRAAKEERERLEAEERRKKEEADKREADTKHKAKIHNEILTAIEKVIVDNPPSGTMKEVVIAIAKGEIPHVKITY
jgi:colicin import membrane protein